MSDRRGARIYTLVTVNSGGAIVRRSTILQENRAGDDDDYDKKKLERRFFVLYEPRMYVCMCVCVCTVYTVPTYSGLAIQVIQPTHFVQVRATRETLAPAYLKRIIIKLMPTIFIIIIIYKCIIVVTVRVGQYYALYIHSHNTPTAKKYNKIFRRIRKFIGTYIIL